MKRVFTGVMILALMGACSGPGEGSTEGDQVEPQTNEMQEAPVTKEEEPTGPVTLYLKTVGETMQEMAYEPSRLSVSAGAEVRLVLENVATAEAMIHNAVIIEAGKQTEVAEAGLEAGPDKEYLPESPYIVAATSLALPGETVEVNFRAPEKKGTYQYICTYPGHMAMKGLLLVK